MKLEAELSFFEKAKGELLKNHDGKFALIKGEEFCGAFDTPDNAYSEGVKRFGNVPFLVKRITLREETFRNQAFFLGLLHAGI